VNLDLAFDDMPALADLGQLEAQDTGLNFSPPGPEQDRAVREVDQMARQFPALRALWAATPVRSSLSLDNAD
jgi:hypothetical protein